MFLLKGTRLRRKLLAYSFSHPDSNYYVRELAHFIDEDPGNLSRELKALENEGLFRSTRRGNIKLYALNKKFPLYDELKSMIAKTEGLEYRLKDLINEFKGINLALIHGDYASDSEHKFADIDLIVAGSFNETRFAGKINALETEFARGINVASYPADKFVTERKKRSSFLSQALKTELILLKGSLNDFQTNPEDLLALSSCR